MLKSQLVKSVSAMLNPAARATVADPMASAKATDTSNSRITMDLPIFQCVGNTPLLKITDHIYAKLETYNPTGSVKDRMIRGIIENAIRDGEIDEDTVLIEATSGNTGIALSAAGAAMGLPVEIFMPCNMSQSRKDMMQAFGAKLHLTGPNDFMAAIAARDALLKTDKKYYTPSQFGNEQNRQAHLDTTCKEIKQQLKEMAPGKKWSAIVNGSGTGGTISAFCQFRKQEGLDYEVVMLEPTEDAASHGIQGIYDGADFLMNRKEIDHTWKIPTKEAEARAAAFAKSHGILIGISAGGNLALAERYVAEKNPEGIVVCMFNDRGERYLNIFE